MNYIVHFCFKVCFIFHRNCLNSNNSRKFGFSKLENDSKTDQTKVRLFERLLNVVAHIYELQGSTTLYCIVNTPPL